MELNKGDVHLVDFNPSKGKEMGKYRPAIIMSKTQDNKILDTVIVIPLSSRLLDNAMPYKFRVNKRDNLLLNSEACINEVRSLSKTRIKEKLTKLTKQEMKTIIHAINQIFSD